ncbi:MAG TPA: VWA domain-containing protein [Lacipirellulaceae bacterium]|jgi:uncharacterized membrane protein
MLAFNNAWYLLLLGLLPFVWWFSFGSLSGLGRWRRAAAIGLRTLVMVLLIGALAETQYQRVNDRVTVIYLLDQSLSIPEARRTEMIRYANASIHAQRRDDKEDRAGVIVFGKNAEVEAPPVDFSIQLAPKIESLLDPNYTNLAGAMQRAMSLFPHDTAKRVVLVTDGNENVGNALEEARTMADAGVSIDVMPVPLVHRTDIAVEKVALPADVRRGQPFELRVVLSDGAPADAKATDVAGHLRIVRKAGERQETLSDQPIKLEPGKRVFSLREEIDVPDFYTYEARFVPDDPNADAITQNDDATAFTHVQGKGQVLLIEDWENPGEFDYLIERLRKSGLEIVVEPSNRLFTSLPELQRYDTIILANVPRTSGEDASDVSSFSDDQIKMLVRNTEELGCGLVMLGGANSYGAGGWTNTDLEKAMPVDFQIKSTKVVPVGALVLNMHAGEIAQANFWQKVIAEEALKALGPRDYCGLTSWNGTSQWLWGQSQGGLLHVGPNRQMMLSKIDKMNVGDMPDFEPGMKQAAIGLAAITDAAIKHMIVISDGDPSPPTAATMAALKAGQVKVTTVAVGSHGLLGSQLMQDIATQTGGKYYVVNNANALPKIYQREARRIARPLVYEPQPPVEPLVKMQHEIVQGLSGAFPPISGFVLTSVKDSSLVEVVLQSPKPTEPENATVLAAWTYGLGKAVAFTTDAGKRWASAWTTWDQYDRFFSQMIRWSMRPTGDTGKFSVAADVEGNKTRVVVTALDQEDQFLNLQTMSGAVLGPDMESIPLNIQQTAPGRYVGEFDSTKAGSYMIMVTPGAGQAMIRTGVSVGYSDEFRERETNTPLLESIAKLTAKGGKAGELLAPLPDLPKNGANPTFDAQLTVDPFRRDLPRAVASQDIWPWLVMMGSCLFFADVFVRRVQISLEWLAPVWARFAETVLRRKRPVATAPTMERLRSRKADIERTIETRRAATRFEPDPTIAAEPGAAQPTATRPAAIGPTSGTAPKQEADQPEAESYTERLLKAKKQVWKDRDKEK